MNAEINKAGELVITPGTKTERYALDVWWEMNCGRSAKGDYPALKKGKYFDVDDYLPNSEKSE